MYVRAAVNMVHSLLLQRKVKGTKQRREERGNSTRLSPGDTKVSNNSSIALMQHITEIGIQGTMKNDKETLHIFPKRISKKPAKGSDIS
jgi:hypothetical protein